MVSSHGCCLQAFHAVLQTTTDDVRRRRPLLVWPGTLCVGGGPVINALSGITSGQSNLTKGHIAHWILVGLSTYETVVAQLTITVVSYETDPLQNCFFPWEILSI